MQTLRFLDILILPRDRQRAADDHGRRRLKPSAIRCLIDGESRNFQITTPEDFDLAEIWLEVAE